MTFLAIDPNTGDMYEVPGKFVECATPGCVNEHIRIEVADDPHGTVVCGPCGNWIIAPPEPEEKP